MLGRSLTAVRLFQSVVQRSFQASACPCGKNTMDKYIEKREGKKKRRQWYVSPPASEMQRILSLGSKESRKLSPAGRRLEAKFDRLIRDRLSTHEEALIRAVTVLEVKLRPSLSSVEVVWLGSGDPAGDLVTQTSLNSIRTELRGALILGNGSNRRPPVTFVKDMRPFYVRQVDQLLTRCSSEQHQLATALSEEKEREEEEEAVERKMKKEEEEAAAERRLEELYPYHKRLREDKERRLAARLAREAAVPTRLVRRPRAVDPDTTEAPVEEAYGLPYEKLRDLVLSASGKAREREDEAAEKAMPWEPEAKLNAAEVRKLAVEARTKALREMKSLQAEWRRQRKSRNFEEEEEEDGH